MRMGMATFDVKVKEFEMNIKDQCEIIRRYDETISTKANRTRVYEEVKQIHDKY
jgi:hypothetical protein